MSAVTKAEVVAAAAIKRFLEMIQEYKDPPAKPRTYRVRKLQKMDTTANAVLAEAFCGLLPSQ